MLHPANTPLKNELYALLKEEGVLFLNRLFTLAEEYNDTDIKKCGDLSHKL